MFNIGGGEFVVIAVLALIVLGPQRLPDVARQIGKTMGDLRRVSAGFQREFQSTLDEVDPAAKDVVRSAMISKVPGVASPLGQGISTAVAAVNAQGRAAGAEDGDAPAPPLDRPEGSPPDDGSLEAAQAAAEKAAGARKTTKRPAAKKAAKKKAAASKPAAKKAAKKKAATSKKAVTKKAAAGKPAAKKAAKNRVAAGKAPAKKAAKRR